MLNKTFEWFRIVHMSPTSQMIDNRKASVSGVLNAIDEASDWNLILGCAAGVVAGFEKNFAQDSPVVELLVGAIRAQESAFPEDISENALELRACAAVALGEIMVRDDQPSPKALLIASVLRSGLGTRPIVQSRHLKRMLDELDGAAVKVITSGSLSRREQISSAAWRFENLSEPADLSTAWKTLLSSLNATMSDIAQQAAIDREELNILWWMFAGTSNTKGHPIAEMPAGAAILCCGAELGNQCLVPPTSSLEAMVQRTYVTGRKPRELSERSIKDVAVDWDDQLPKILVPDSASRNLATNYPSLLPLSWLCDRLLASKGAAGWHSEFERMTGISPNHACRPTQWALQAFRERIVHRVYQENLGD